MLVKRRTKNRDAAADDMMLGLKESDEPAFSPRFWQFAKAHECVHLVNIAANLFGCPMKTANQRVSLVIERMATALKPKQQCVKQSEALRVRVANDIAREINEGSWNWERWRFRRCPIRPEQVGVTTFNLPNDGARRDAGFGEVTRGVPPTIQIIGRCQNYAVRVDHQSLAKHA